MNDDGSFKGCSALSHKQLNRIESLQNLCPDARCETKRIAVRNPNGSHDFVILARVHYRKVKWSPKTGPPIKL
jgi:hypothetical protein